MSRAVGTSRPVDPSGRRSGRTFSRAHWNEAQELWAEGEFSNEWRDVRHQAALRGMLYPPTGTNLDSWDEDQPSQRAVLIRAIRETPVLLRQAIATSRSWAEVCAVVFRERDGWRERLDDEDRDLRAEKADEPTHREAVMALKAVLVRIGDS